VSMCTLNHRNELIYNGMLR